MAPRHERSQLRTTASKLIAIIESLPVTHQRDTRKDWLAPPSLSDFKRLEPIGWEEEFHVDDDWWVFNPQECTPKVIWPVKTALIAEHSDGVSMSVWRSVTMQESRGYAKLVSKYMLRSDVAEANDGRWVTAATLWTWLGNRWANSQAHADTPTDYPLAATAVALRQRYEWAVAIGFGGPSIRFATDPTGIKELWKVRDVPEGRDRRPMLNAWISDHWRQDRYDPELEIYVRKHLRGATTFTWRDVQGEILPSQFDVERRNKLIAERKAMREAGIDRRFKT